MTSDHGMSEVRENLIFEDYIDDDELFVIETGPVMTAYAKNSNNIQNVIEQLKQVPRVTVYKKQDIPDKWHYRDNPRVPDIIAVSDDGTNIVSNSCFNVLYIYLENWLNTKMLAFIIGIKTLI